MNPSASRTALAILLVALIQSAALGWMIWERISLLRDGRAIVLDAEPADPQALFRGDHVILTYPISTLDTDQLGGDDEFDMHDEIYVALTPGPDRTWLPRSIHRTKPRNAPDNTVFLRGTVTSRLGRPAARSGESCDTDCPALSVKYGIESYFVPEGEGRRLEDLRGSRRIQVAARVAASGETAIAGLAIDGRIRYEDPLF